MFSNIYPEFHQLYPQVHIDPMELSVHDQNPLLLSGQLDIGFMTLFESQEKKGLEYLRITKDHAIVSAVHSGICCGIIPMYYVRPQDSHIRYFVLPEHPEWNICAAHRKDHYLTKAAREFIFLAARYFQTLS